MNNEVQEIIQIDINSKLERLFSKWIVHVLDRDLQSRVVFLTNELLPEIFGDNSFLSSVGKKWEEDRVTSHDKAIKRFHLDFEFAFQKLQDFFNWQEEETGDFIDNDLKPMLLKLFEAIPFRFNFEYSS